MGPSAADRRARLTQDHPEWVPQTIAGRLAAAARRYPDRPYVITDRGSWTYRQMHEWSRRIARGLLARGVRPGEHVAMVLANYAEFVALKYAIASIGAVAVPVNFLLKERELEYVLRQSDSALLVTMDSFRGLDYLRMLDGICPGWERDGGGRSLPRLREVVVFSETAPPRPHAHRFSELEAAGDPAGEVALAPGRAEDVCDIVYTSGTTGRPKGAMLTHDNVLRCSFASAWVRAFDDGRRLLFALPLYHVFAYVEGLLAVTWVGGAAVAQLAFDPVATLRDVARHQVNEALFVPTMTVATVEHPARRDYDLSSLHTVMSAAAPAPVRLWERVRAELGVRDVTTAYGQTEVAASTTFTMPGDPLEIVSATVGRPKPGAAAGDPALGGLAAAYKTVDPITGDDLPAGAEGELAVTGPQVMRGYYGKPGETAAVLGPDGWFRSGDLGRIREDGYVVLTGRSTELYKCGGELVAPREIEELLTGRPDVSQAYVVGLPDDRMGEIGCAVVVAAPGADPEPGELTAFCARNLARFKVPAHVLFFDAAELPVTPTGKVQKFRLVAQARARLEPTTTTG